MSKGPGRLKLGSREHCLAQFGEYAHTALLYRTKAKLATDPKWRASHIETARMFGRFARAQFALFQAA